MSDPVIVDNEFSNVLGQLMHNLVRTVESGSVIIPLFKSQEKKVDHVSRHAER